MQSLDSKQVSVIREFVARSGVTYSHLPEELLDHLCCEVEAAMNSGRSFEEACHSILPFTEPGVLQKIQENTLYLIDQKYRLMKTSMKITGNISLALLAIGTVFKIFHWPGANLMYGLGFAMLVLLFFPALVFLNNREQSQGKNHIRNMALLAGGTCLMTGALFKVLHLPGSGPLLLAGWAITLGIFLPLTVIRELKSEGNAKEKSVIILGAFALIIFELALMFKIFHWPGASVMIILGSFLLVGVFLPWFTRLRIAQSKLSHGQFVFLIIIAMNAVLLTALLSLRVSSNVFAQYVRDAETTHQVLHYYSAKKQSLPDSIRTSTLSVLADKTDALIESVQAELILQGEDPKMSADEVRKLMANPGEIQAKDNSKTTEEVMFGKDGIDGKVGILLMAINEFRDSALVRVAASESLKHRLESLLSTAPVGDQSWEDKHFRDASLMYAFTALSQFRRDIRAAESMVIEFSYSPVLTEK